MFWGEDPRGFDVDLLRSGVVPLRYGGMLGDLKFGVLWAGICAACAGRVPVWGMRDGRSVTVAVPVDVVGMGIPSRSLADFC